jgi:predicted AAA+ superfamily ATPase
VGQSLGLSYHTVDNYLEYLEGAYLIRRLPAYQANIRKRLLKSPNVYWRDCGLLHALMKVPDRQSLLTQPWVGASWEGYVIEQVLGELSSRGGDYSAYHFRTADQYEIDLVLDFGDEIWAVEVKLTSSPTPDDMARLDKTADLIKAKRRLLVSQTRRSSGDSRRVSCDLSTLLKRLPK